MTNFEKFAKNCVNLLCNREISPITHFNFSSITYHNSMLCNCVIGLKFYYTVTHWTGTCGEGVINGV